MSKLNPDDIITVEIPALIAEDDPTDKWMKLGRERATRDISPHPSTEYHFCRSNKGGAK